MNRRRLTLVIVAILMPLVGLSGQAVAGSKSKSKGKHVEPVLFEPDVDREKVPPGEIPVDDEGVWTFGGDTFRMRLLKLDTAGRRKLLKRMTGLEIDPFATRPDRPEGFVTFLLVVENRGPGNLAFNPQDCWLVTTNMRTEYPLDMTTIRFAFSSLEGEMPPAYEHVDKALLQHGVTLEPGESVSGMLAYRYPHERMKKFRVDLQATLFDGDVARFSAPYRRVKVKKN